MPPRVVMFVSRDPGHRQLYLTDLRRLGLLSVWVDAVDDARKLLAHYRVAAIVVHVASADDWRPPVELIAAARSSPVLVLGSGGWNAVGQIERAFEGGCAGVITESCTAATLAAIVRRSIGGERGIQWPDRVVAEVG
jgi:DNA-binding NarL/FixJ family response regulator